MNTLNLNDYRQDARGNLIPIKNIRPIDLMRDELVQELVSKAHACAEQLQAFKQKALDDIAAFVQLSADRYDIKIGGRKGNITLHSFDGKYRVLLAVQDRLIFDEGLQAAKKLIDECIEEWTSQSRNEVRVLINAAFDADNEGNISTARVLGLRRLQIEDAKWQMAMDALADSLMVVTSKSFVRVYVRQENQEYKLLNLDIAKV